MLWMMTTTAISALFALCEITLQTGVHLRRFDRVLRRLDEEALEHALGAEVVRLLTLLGPELSTPTSLREVLEAMRPDWELLRDPSLRGALFDALTPIEATELAAHAGSGDETSNNPYASLRAKPWRSGSQLEGLLFDWFDVARPRDSDHQAAVPLSLIAPQHGLFAHQRKALRAATSILEDGDPPRVMLHMPTGGGKTRTAMQLVANWLRSSEPAIAVWLAYSEELCEQAAEEFEATWRCVGDRELHVYRMWGESNLEISDVRDGIFIAGLSKLYARCRRDSDFLFRLADRSRLVVFDEAHQVIAPTYQFILQALLDRDPSRPLLGLTATPGRTYNDPDEDSRLADFFGRQKVTLEVEGWISPIDFLIDRGYLAQPTFRDITFSGGPDLTSSDLQDIARSLDLPRKVLDRLGRDEQRNLLIVRTVEELAKRHSRILVFAASVYHARLLAAVLRQRSLQAEAITADTSRTQRSQLLTSYKKPSTEPMILTNYGVLTTGFDAPRTSAAVIARPTGSLVLYSQMVGRAIRGPLVGGNKYAEIATIVDTKLPGFRSLAESFTNWEDVW